MRKLISFQATYRIICSKAHSLCQIIDAVGTMKCFCFRARYLHRNKLKQNRNQ